MTREILERFIPERLPSRTGLPLRLASPVALPSQEKTAAPHEPHTPPSPVDARDLLAALVAAPPRPRPPPQAGARRGAAEEQQHQRRGCQHARGEEGAGERGVAAQAAAETGEVAREEMRRPHVHGVEGALVVGSIAWRDGVSNGRTDGATSGRSGGKGRAGDGEAHRVCVLGLLLPRADRQAVSFVPLEPWMRGALS